MDSATGVVAMTNTAPVPRRRRQSPPEQPPGHLLGPRTWLLVALGLAIRLALAWHWRAQSAEWEADGFVRAWEGSPWGAMYRLRAPLGAWVLHALVHGLQVTSVLGTRLVAIGVSLAGLLAALWALSRLMRFLRSPARSPGLAGAWLAGWWAVFPSLCSAAVRPTADSVLGPMLCLLLGALLCFGERRRPWSAALLLVASVAALLAGGLVVACVLVAGLLVYLCGLPRFGAALPLIVVLAGALGLAWLVQRGPDSGRLWLPDIGPVISVEALVGKAPPVDDRDTVDADLRGQEAIDTAWQGLRERGALGVAKRFAERLVLDQLGAERFLDWGLEDAGLSHLPVWLLDVFVRGGLLLFALASMSSVRSSPGSGLPRAGVAMGLVLLVLLLVLGATSPLALAPFDLLLLAVAAGGIAAADPRSVGLRWGAFCIGGSLLLMVSLSLVFTGHRAAEWPRTLNHADQQGSHLVTALADGGPTSLAGQLLVTHLLTDPASPFLRLPEAALDHALAASRLDPDAPEVIEALVASYAEVGDWPAAETLIASLVDEFGLPTATGRALEQWLRRMKRQERQAEHR